MEKDFEEKKLMEEKASRKENKTPGYFKVTSLSIISKILTVIHLLIYLMGFLIILHVLLQYKLYMGRYYDIVLLEIGFVYEIIISIVSIYGAYGCVSKWERVRKVLAVLSVGHSIILLNGICGVMGYYLVYVQQKDSMYSALAIFLSAIYVLDMGSMLTTVYMYKAQGKRTESNYLFTFYYSKGEEVKEGKNRIISILLVICSSLTIIIYSFQGISTILYSDIDYQDIFYLILYGLRVVSGIYILRQVFVSKERWQENRDITMCIGVLSTFLFMTITFLSLRGTALSLIHYLFFISDFGLAALLCFLCLYMYRGDSPHEVLEEKSGVSKYI